MTHTRRAPPSHVLTVHYQGAAGRAHDEGDEARAMRLLKIADAYMTVALTGRGRKLADAMARVEMTEAQAYVAGWRYHSEGQHPDTGYAWTHGWLEAEEPEPECAGYGPAEDLR